VSLSAAYDLRENYDESSSVSQSARNHFEMIRWTTRTAVLLETPDIVLENHTVVNIPAVASTGNLLGTGACDRIIDDGFIAGTKKNLGPI
jgi:hypothetical protein